MADPAPIVLKFGGAALSDPAKVLRWIRLRGARGSPLVVVVSAREGVTDRLLRSVRPPIRDRPIDRLIDDLRRRHPVAPSAIDPILDTVRATVRRLAQRRTAAPAEIDRLAAQGERLAAVWLAHEMALRGIAATPVDADRLGLRTDRHFGSARIRIDASRPAVRRGIGRIWAEGRVPVVTGFFGRGPGGTVATLGRGGSDYSATALGAILGARRVELLKQRVSIRSADPRWVARSRPLSYLSYEEAEELAQFGARVLHAWAIEPARRAGIPILVRSLADPRQTTTVGPAIDHGTPRALTVLPSLRLLGLRVPGGREQPGIMAEVTRCLAEARVNLVQLYTSATLLCAIVESREAGPARRALARLARPRDMTVEAPLEVNMVIAIGERILEDLPRVPTSILTATLGIAATPRALSLAVRRSDLGPTLRALHQALVEAPARP
ncbi:MAG: aspartate kinase [Thermoplasmata archaeon]|jgi:aspartate kinase